MEVYADSVFDAIKILEAKGYFYENGRQKYYQGSESKINGVLECFTDDEFGDETIYWTGRLTDKVSPGNSKVVEFTC